MTQTLTVTGMTCDGCERAVEQALMDVPGVKSASADRDSESVTVDGEADDELVAAVQEAGYDASAGPA